MNNRNDDSSKKPRRHIFSSDDDDDDAEFTNIALNGSNHVNDVLLNSGSGTTPTEPCVQPTTSTAPRRNPLKHERDLFWSWLNNSGQPYSCSRFMDVPLSLVQASKSSNNTGSEGRDRNPSRIADIRRIIEFKKLTHSLNNSRRLANGAESLPSTSRGRVVLTSPLAKPRLKHSTVRKPNMYSNLNKYPSTPHTYVSARPVRGARCPVLEMSEIDTVADQTLSHSDDDIEMSTAPLPPISARRADDTTNRSATQEISQHIDMSATQILPIIGRRPDDAANGNVTQEISQPRNATGEISLEEEIVEIDGPDEADANTSLEVIVCDETNINQPAEQQSKDNTATSAEVSPNAKKTSYDKHNEILSAKEFNHSLLTLLECPVCLEWMEPPISQCRRGHLVCSKCRTRLSSCPVCRTMFTSVRNRAMEGVAEMLRYPCRHGCGREVRLRYRGSHEASCESRRYQCPAPTCADRAPMAHEELSQHFESKHLPILKIGAKQSLLMKVNAEQHDTWLIMALDELFYLRVDVNVRTWGVMVYVAYIGPQRKANNFKYEVQINGFNNSRKITYTRDTHSDLESSSIIVTRQDCFHISLDQAVNYVRFKNKDYMPETLLDFHVEISKNYNTEDQNENSDS